MYKLNTTELKGTGLLSNKVEYIYSWDLLYYWWKGLNYPTIKFDRTDDFWTIAERLENDSVFSMKRNRSSLRRETLFDQYGLLGTSLINLKDKSVILTEGVSDFFSVKLLNPECNVLGITTLGGSRAAKAIILNLFDDVLICADNDLKESGSKQTGLNNAFNWKQLLESYNKNVEIFIPDYPCKDMTDILVKETKAYLYL